MQLYGKLVKWCYEKAEIMDIIFGDNNQLYCHIAVYDENAYLTDMEAVWEISTDGEIVREIIHYDYQNSDNQPSYQVRMKGIHYSEDKFTYLYEEDGEYSIVEVNPDNPQQSSRTFIDNEGFAQIVECNDTSEGKFIVLKNNGEIGFISVDGKYEIMYKAVYDARKQEGLLPCEVFVIENRLYMLTCQDKLALYEMEYNQSKENDDKSNESDEYKLQQNDVNYNNWKKICCVEESIRLPENANLNNYELGEYEHKLGINVNESIYILEDGNRLEKCTDAFELPNHIVSVMYLREGLLVLGVLCLVFGVFLGTGNIMKWRFSLLSKQILSTIPIVCIMLAVVIAIMFISMIDLSNEDIIKEMIAINEIAASQFEGEELEDLTNYESVDNGKVKKLNDTLRELTDGNKRSWSSKYSMYVFMRTTGEKYMCVASSDESKRYMLDKIAFGASIDKYFYEDSDTFVDGLSEGEDRKHLYLFAMTPIYLEDGSYNAVLILRASQDSLLEELINAGISLLINILLWGTVLILAITLVALRNVKSLRRAKDVIAQIAGGDFSVRVEKYSKDEVGEICVGVNDMADRLEEYFEETVKNEQFYYKFVPAKFCKLLHRNKFTDLELGDARSKDLSILFCDIRAFSMNSEMMTAKESFDFVNKIYGKAGPIIRKHNGFIDKYIGDAVMALFESADDAVNAGIELYQAIVLCPNPEEDFGISSVKVGVGIHSGMARIGIVGEEERMSGTVIADTVNLSSRIESLTKRYGAGMIISKDTLDRMKNPDVLSTRYLGMVQVAGVNEVVALYEVMDCLEKEQCNKREQTKNEFREAVRLFHTGEMRKSIDIFRELIEQNPDDKAAKLYADYIEEKIERGSNEYNIFVNFL